LKGATGNPIPGLLGSVPGSGALLALTWEMDSMSEGSDKPVRSTGTELDTATKLVQTPGRTGWWLTVYPTAGEAGGSFRYENRGRGRTEPYEEEPGRSEREAARRARGHVRRFCSANRLNRLGTLTYRGEGCHDPYRFRRDVGVFVRRLRQGVGVERMAYLWVPEWHPKGHGLHGHFAVGRYVRRGIIEQAWPHGFVHIKLIGDLPVGSGGLAEARQAGRYLGKYVSKDPASGSGLHRYEVAQGFQPERVAVWGRTAEAALAKASDIFGCEPEKVWRSQDEERWDGPPAVWASWAG